MNYAEEQLQYAIEKENNKTINYQDKLLELAKKEGIQALQGQKLEDIYNRVFQKILKENEELKEISNKNAIIIEDLEKAIHRLQVDKYNLNLRKENLERKCELFNQSNSKMAEDEILKEEINSSEINILIYKNIARILKEMITRTNDDEIKKLIDMINILRMTKI
jgi:hypothetical protein